MINRLEELPEDIRLKIKSNHEQIVYITKVGSQLYGTDNENSDTDYRGIFIPTMDQLITKTDKDHIILAKGNGDKQKNTSEDCDFDLWSIHKFLNLLQKGDTGAFDLLYSLYREDTQIFNGGDMDIISDRAQQFITTNTKAFTGYCVSQAAKYGIKGNRYKELKRFVDPELLHKDEMGLSRIKKYMYDWDLSDYKYIKIVSGEGANRSEQNYLDVLGKKFGENITVSEFHSKINDMLNKYGDRSKASANGVDWKALSHAVRVLSQVKELIQDRKMTFPLKEVHLVKAIKEELLTLKEVQEEIEFRLAEIDELVKNSELPDKVPTELTNNILYELY